MGHFIWDNIMDKLSNAISKEKEEKAKKTYPVTIRKYEPELLRDLKAIHGDDEGSKIYLKYTNEKNLRNIELQNADELVDLFADAMKERIRSGDIRFIENNEWLKNPDFDKIDKEFRTELMNNDNLGMVVYLAMEWYHQYNRE
jgi:hypothetical protein